eukprot:4709975-Pleurochrysis_carterae.AAC.1
MRKDVSTGGGGIHGQPSQFGGSHLELEAADPRHPIHRPPYRSPTQAPHPSHGCLDHKSAAPLLHAADAALL